MYLCTVEPSPDRFQPPRVRDDLIIVNSTQLAIIGLLQLSSKLRLVLPEHPRIRSFISKTWATWAETSYLGRRVYTWVETCSREINQFHLSILVRKLEVKKKIISFKSET
jgi:hypothetical protein